MKEVAAEEVYVCRGEVGEVLTVNKAPRPSAHCGLGQIDMLILGMRGQFVLKYLVHTCAKEQAIACDLQSLSLKL